MNGRENKEHREHREPHRVRPVREHCVSDVVKFINELQECATNVCPTGCDVPFLGANPHVPLANTRPILLFLPNGELFRVPAFFNREHDDRKNEDHDEHRERCRDSVVFRVESVDDHCAVLRALVSRRRDNDNDNDNNKNNNNNNNNGDKDNDRDRDRDEFCDLVRSDRRFVASNTCVTVDLDFFVAIQCLRDTHVRNL